MKFRLFLAIASLLILSYSLPCHGYEDRPTMAVCFTQAAEHYNIPVELLLAIAEVESGLSPNAINLAGTSYQPPSRKDADLILERISGQRATFDVGIMQVNRWWFEKYGEPYEKGLDICFNVDFGARILAMAIKDHGFTWEAVGSYHSPTSWRKNAYARKIFARLSRLLEKRISTPQEKIVDIKTGDLAFKQLPDDPEQTSASSQ